MNQQLIYLKIKSFFLDKEKFSEKIQYFILNGAANQFIYYQDLNFDNKLILEETWKNAKHVFETNSLVKLYAITQNFKVEIEIEINNQFEYIVKLFPLSPYKEKKLFDDNKYLIDIGFYIKLAMQFCENFPIEEFYTKEF